MIWCTLLRASLDISVGQIWPGGHQLSVTAVRHTHVLFDFKIIMNEFFLWVNWSGSICCSIISKAAYLCAQPTVKESLQRSSRQRWPGLSNNLLMWSSMQFWPRLQRTTSRCRSGCCTAERVGKVMRSGTESTGSDLLRCYEKDLVSFQYINWSFFKEVTNLS